MIKRTVLAGILAATSLAACSSSGPKPAAPARPTASRAPAAAPAATPAGQIDFHNWQSRSDWSAGAGTATIGGATGLTLAAHAAGTTGYHDPHKNKTSTWSYGTWTSPSHAIGFGATELVSSWNATTPTGTWIEVQLLGVYADGTKTPAYVMGRWASGDGDIDRASVDHQSDGSSQINTDTFVIANGSDARLASYRLKVTLYRKPGQATGPVLREVAAFASALPQRGTVAADDGPASAHPAWGTELNVPPFSQNIHTGQYDRYDGGGEAWCSATSTAMVVAYWHRAPTRAQSAWVDASYADPQVDVAARGVFDYQYDGTGNWPFNAAYAASFGLDAIVTQIRSLDDAEVLIAAGIPVVAAVAFKSFELDGANYSTDGHLLVIVGFTKTGDVITNDPASNGDKAVRNIYRRDQFAQVWLRTTGGSSGGVAYLIKPHDKPWPKPSGSVTW
ncbi:MAG TPA: C39 family peptidase [Micromonosporaceae bacterium]|jgi:hypothetical protein